MEAKYKLWIMVGLIVLVLILILGYLTSQCFFGSIGVPGLQPAP